MDRHRCLPPLPPSAPAAALAGWSWRLFLGLDRTASIPLAMPTASCVAPGVQSKERTGLGYFVACTSSNVSSS